MSSVHWAFASGALESASASTAGGSSATRVAPGGRVGPFTVERELGQGGMGRVLGVRLGEEAFALKLILHDRERVRQRLAREAEIVGGLAHPGIVPLRGAGVLGETPFLLYDLVRDARPLTAAWAKLELADRVRLLARVAEAVGYAHSCGVLHRDLKPDNVLVDALGEPRVIDFGLARHAEQERMTQTGAWLGTPAYMAPEQFEAATDAQRPAVDVWSLGVILFEALTDRLPFEAESMLELAVKVQSEDPPSPRVVNPEVPLALEAVCLRALDKDPELRYPDGRTLARELLLALRASAVGRGSWRLPGLGAAAALILCAGVAWSQLAPEPRNEAAAAAAHAALWEQRTREWEADRLVRVGRALVESDPEDLEVRQAFMVGLERSAEPAAALAQAEALLARDRSRVRAWETRAGSLYQLGRIADSQEVARQATQQFPERSALWTIRALCAIHEDEPEVALPFAERAVELRPDDLSAVSARGMARQLTGDVEGALADHGRVIEANNNYHARFNRAHLYKDRGDYARALEDFLAAAEQGGPADVQVQVGRLQCLIELDLSQALELSLELCRDFPANQELALLRARALERAGRIEPAQRAYRAALELDPQSNLGRYARRKLEALGGR